MSRLAPVPPELERLEDCVQELMAGKAGPPTGLPNSRDSIREYFWDRVFPGVDWPIRLRGEEATRVTKIAGREITLEAVRNQVLNDIEDLVTYMVSPSGAGIREETRSRIVTSVDGQPFNAQLEQGTRAVESPNKKAFSDQLNKFEARNGNRSRVQSRGGDWSSMGLPIDRRRNVKNQTPVDEALSPSKIQLDRLRIPEDEELPEGSPTPRQHTINDHAFGVGLDHERAVPSSKGQVPTGDGSVAQAAPGPFAYGVPPQHITFGGYPLPMYAAPPFGAQMTPAQNPWTVQRGPYGAYQPLPYGNPWQQAYAQPPSAYGQPPMTAYTPSPMPSPYTYARPAATNRVARLFAQSNAVQSRETQARPHSQNTEWQNRFVTLPAVVPEVPILPYRVASDDMYPHLTGTASVRYQNLTRTDPVSVEVATAEENVPFAENARLTKPPQWGVMKIGNVSSEHLDCCN